MPRLSLKRRTSRRAKYRAKAMSSLDQNLKTAQPVSPDTLQPTPVAAALADVAVDAEVCAEPISATSRFDSSVDSTTSKNSTKHPLRHSARSASKILPRRLLRSVKLKALRHATVKAAKATQTTESTKAARLSKTAKAKSLKSSEAPISSQSFLSQAITSNDVPSPSVSASTLTSDSGFHILHDGDHIYLRPGRTAPSSVAEHYIKSSNNVLSQDFANSGPATISTSDAKSIKAAKKYAEKSVKKPTRLLKRSTKNAKKAKNTKSTQKSAEQSQPSGQSTTSSLQNMLYRKSLFGRRRRPTRADLINAESRLGSTIFGPVPAGHRREFFHDRENIWIWHEGWIDEDHHLRQMTIRYEIRPSGVYKKISAGKYFKLEGDELENFRRATHAYLNIIKQYLYSNAPAA